MPDPDCSRIMPNLFSVKSQFRSVANLQLPEDAMQIILDCTLGQTEVPSDFFVRFRLLNQADDLLFTKR